MAQGFSDVRGVVIEKAEDGGLKEAEGGGTQIFLFESSTHVMWAEEVAEEDGIPVSVISAPEETKDACGLAVRTFSDRAEALAGILREESIPFKLYP